MSPDERDRLAKVEQIVSSQQEALKSIEAKLDHLTSIADMGKGALWLALKVGGVMTVLIAALWAIFDKVLHRAG
jgi:hypothetical protein